jgi:hypothetical protein
MNQPKSLVHDVGILDSQAAAPQLSTAHEQTGVLSARNERNLTGKGIKVGVIGNVSPGQLSFCISTEGERFIN